MATSQLITDPASQPPLMSPPGKISTPAPTVAATGVLVCDGSGAALSTISARQLDHVALLNRLDDACVLLVAAAAGDSVFRALNGLARMSPGPRVRVYRTGAAPTLLAHVVAVMNAGRFGPGDILEVLRGVRAAATTVAITNSVAHLTWPAPSIWQHARGVLPGARFVIDNPGQRVLSGQQALRKLKRFGTGTLTIASAPDLQSVRWRTELAALAPGAPVHLIGDLGPASVPWRARVWAEVTGLPVTPDKFAAQLRPYLGRQSCPSCGSAVSGTVCPMCAIVCEATTTSVRSRRRATVAEADFDAMITPVTRRMGRSR